MASDHVPVKGLTFRCKFGAVNWVSFRPRITQKHENKNITNEAGKIGNARAKNSKNFGVNGYGIRARGSQGGAKRSTKNLAFLRRWGMLGASNQIDACWAPPIKYRFIDVDKVKI